MKDMIKFLALLLIAVGAGPASAAYWQWSRTAATNAGADPSINWAEGMSPSSVNDSARAMMARAAEQRDDVSGLLVTGGTSTAYTVTTNQGLNTPTPTDGQMIAVTMHATNGISATLAADGGTAYPVLSATGIPVASGTLVSGSPYSVKFSAANSAWMLRNFYGSPFSVPLGGVVVFTGATSPNSNFVFAIGQCISRTTYAAYFAMVAATYGACDGTTTFGVPDLRERSISFQGTMGGASSPGRITSGGSGIDGSTLAANGGSQTVTLGTNNLPAYTPSGNVSAPTVTINGQNVGTLTFGGSPQTVTATVSPGGVTVTTLTASATAPIFSGNAQGGTSAPVNNMPPTIILTALVRIF